MDETIEDMMTDFIACLGNVHECQKELDKSIASCDQSSGYWCSGEQDNLTQAKAELAATLARIIVVLQILPQPQVEQPSQEPAVVAELFHELVPQIILKPQRFNLVLDAVVLDEVVWLVRHRLSLRARCTVLLHPVLNAAFGKVNQ